MNETMRALLQNWDMSLSCHKKFKKLIGYRDRSQQLLAAGNRRVIKPQTSLKTLELAADDQNAVVGHQDNKKKR